MSVLITGWSSAPFVIRTRSTVVVEPVEEPVSLSDAKAWARMPLNDDDLLIAQRIRVAREQVERETGIALLTQTIDVSFDRPPSVSNPLPVPWKPIQSVTSVKVIASDGSTVTTVDASNYVLLGDRLWLSDAGAWPTDIRVSAWPWTLRIVAGYTAASLIPSSLLEAVSARVSYLCGLPDANERYHECLASFRPVILA